MSLMPASSRSKALISDLYDSNNGSYSQASPEAQSSLNQLPVDSPWATDFPRWRKLFWLSQPFHFLFSRFFFSAYSILVSGISVSLREKGNLSKFISTKYFTSPRLSCKTDSVYFSLNVMYKFQLIFPAGSICVCLDIHLLWSLFFFFFTKVARLKC